jgi:hypothetical protein
MTYSPSRREGARGWATQFSPPSVPAPIFCTRWVYMRIVGAMEAVGKEARTCRLSCGLLSIRELSGVDRLYRTVKGAEWKRGTRGTASPNYIAARAAMPHFASGVVAVFVTRWMGRVGTLRPGDTYLSTRWSLIKGHAPVPSKKSSAFRKAAPSGLNEAYGSAVSGNISSAIKLTSTVRWLTSIGTR